MGVRQDSVLWCGDFNSHNSLWGSNSNDANGILLEEFIDEKYLVCLNNGEGTRYNCFKNTESVLDLTFISSSLAAVSTWKVLKHNTIGSDHYPVVTKIGLKIMYEKEDRIPRWKLEKANWKEFQELCDKRVMTIQIINQRDVNILNNKIVNEIIQAAEEIIPKSKGVGCTKNVPWWNNDCKAAIKARNKAFRHLKKHHSLEAMIMYKKAQTMLRKTIKTQKRIFWREYCNSLGREVQLSEVWGMIRRMAGVRRNYELPVLQYGDIVAISNLEKAELLVQHFRNVHSSDNLSEEARKCRNTTLTKHPDLLKKVKTTENPLDLQFNMFELKRAIISARQTAPGKDEICYKMLSHMSEASLEIVLNLFNQIWDMGQLPIAWKQSIVVHILKPGKNPSDPSSYRPISLTSHLCKIMERMITERITYFLESKNLFSPYQSGFRRGRNTMDSVLCLESDIRKAQTNKEVVIAIFFDIEKAYDMLWKEGLLIKLKSLGVTGKTYNWVMDFLFGRKIQVRVGKEYSHEYTVENGTPQGSVCSPLLFNIMINDIFSQIEQSIGKSLYADDGALWIRGRNVSFVQKKIQNAIFEVEKWANKWGFKLSVAKTQVICFSRRHKTTSLALKLYGQPLEQVKTVRFLGVWFDEKLTWKDHLNKITEKSKKVINVLRCLSGQEWGASRTSLQNIYWALMRSVFDYGCIAYMSAAESNLKKLDVLQAQALRICSGSFRTSPVSSMQVEMGEMPLSIRRMKLMMAYWVNIQGQIESHPTKRTLLECWEHEETNFISFGWIAEAKARIIGLDQLQYCKAVPIPYIPPWFFPLPKVDFNIQQELKDNNNILPTKYIVQNYLEKNYKESIFLFTDGSKDPQTGHTGAAVYIPVNQYHIKKRITNNISVYTTELIAILIALQWIEENDIYNVVIASDSFSSLESIRSGRSSYRMDILNNILSKTYYIKMKGKSVYFIWVPAHVGVEGNEKADFLAKQALRISKVNLEVPLSKAEAKIMIRTYAQSIWQVHWDNIDTGRHLYNIQKQVGTGRKENRNRREGSIITRMRIGHTGLNHTLHKIGKHPTGQCIHCNQQETIEHILFHCSKYNKERNNLIQSVKKSNLQHFTLAGLLGNKSSEVYNDIIKFIKETQLEERI